MKKLLGLLVLSCTASVYAYKPPIGSYGYVIGAVNQARGMPADSAKELGPSADGLTFTYIFKAIGSDDRLREFKINAVRPANKTFAYGFITSHVLGYADIEAAASIAIFQASLAQDCLAMPSDDAKSYRLWAIEKVVAALKTDGGKYEKKFGGVTVAAGVMVDAGHNLVAFVNAARYEPVGTASWPFYCRVK